MLVLGKSERAALACERALEIETAAFGAHHLQVAAGLYLLSAALQDQGQYDKARRLGERALAIREDLAGPDSPSVAQSMIQLAELHMAVEDYEEARPLYERSLSIYERVFGVNHPAVATCLDYLAESFMAGDPLNGGGFVILNGISLSDGKIVELETPYLGGNLFSLASGGAIYIRDPYKKVTEDQLNGGEFTDIDESDWAIIRPYLEENEQLFGVLLARLLEVEGETRSPKEIYRKIRPCAVRALQAEEAWVKERD